MHISDIPPKTYNLLLKNIQKIDDWGKLGILILSQKNQVFQSDCVRLVKRKCIFKFKKIFSLSLHSKDRELKVIF